MDHREAREAPQTATGGVANGNAPARDTFEKRMAIDVSVVRDLAALRALEAEWRALAGSGPGALFRGPDWLIPCRSTAAPSRSRCSTRASCG
jgi:CelD/BcsL family acetyltransferase involved in cellulose biosynthesis